MLFNFILFMLVIIRRMSRDLVISRGEKKLPHFFIIIPCAWDVSRLDETRQGKGGKNTWVLEKEKKKVEPNLHVSFLVS